MEKEEFKGKWNQLKGSFKNAWSDLTDDEIKGVEGDYDNAVGLIQEKYGMAKADAKERINKLIKDLKGK